MTDSTGAGTERSSFKCKQCGYEFPEGHDASPNVDWTCPVCGAQDVVGKVLLSDTIPPALDFVRLKATDGPGKGGKVAEGKYGAEKFRQTGEVRQVFRTIDHRNKEYDEVIRDSAGEVVREVHEDLRHHTGRGPVRKKP